MTHQPSDPDDDFFPTNSEGKITMDVDDSSTAEFLLHRRHSIARIQGRNFNTRSEENLLQSGAWLQSLKRPEDEADSTAEFPPFITGDFGWNLSPIVLERALASARIIAVTEGFSAVTLEDVIMLADFSGIEVDALKKVFPDGPSLCVRLIEIFYKPLIGDLSVKAVDTGDKILFEKLLDVVRGWFVTAQKDVPFFFLVSDTWRHPSIANAAPPVVSAAVMDSVNRWFAVVTGLIAECQLRGEIREGSPELFTHAVSAALVGFMATVSRPELLLESGIYIEDLVDMLIDSYRRTYGTAPVD